MTANEFLKYAGLESNTINLYYLTKYLGDKVNFVSFPEAEVTDRNGEPLAEAPYEPNDFRDYADNISTGVIGNIDIFSFLINVMYKNDTT